MSKIEPLALGLCPLGCLLFVATQKSLLYTIGWVLGALLPRVQPCELIEHFMVTVHSAF